MSDYVSTRDYSTRDKCYNDFICQGLKEIIENIVNTFKFHYLPNLSERKMECLIAVTEKLDKFDPSRGYKAFSFFSVTIKHWFIIESNKFKKTKKVDMYLDDLKERYKEYSVITTNLVVEGSDCALDKKEYVESFVKDLGIWGDRMRKNTNLFIVYDSILSLFKNLEILDSTVIDRNAIYIHIQADTGLSSSQIANAIYRLRKKYKHFNIKWNN